MAICARKCNVVEMHAFFVVALFNEIVVWLGNSYLSFSASSSELTTQIVNNVTIKQEQLYALCGSTYSYPVLVVT